MEPVVKLGCGALSVVALAWAAHAVGNGRALLNSLTEKSQAALSQEGLGGVNVSFEDAPMRRVAVLSGTNDPAIRQSALDVVSNVAGVMDARWATTDPVAAAANATAQAPATNEVREVPLDAQGHPVGPAPAALPEPAKPASAQAAAAAPAAAPATPSSCQGKVDAAVAKRAITFRDRSPWVNGPARLLLADVAKAVNACPGSSITLGAWGDAKGDPSVNQSLSVERANALKTVLAEKGLAAARIIAKPQGAAPASVGDNRVTFTVGGGNGALPATSQSGGRIRFTANGG